MESQIGGRVKQFRESKGLRQNAFCEAAGMRQQTLSTIESGSSDPSTPVLTKILSAFPDLNPDWLLLGTGTMLRDGRTLTPADQLPPQVPSKLEPPQAPARPVLPTPDEWRENMRVVAESAELREVKSERDNLRRTNEQLLDIIRNFTGGNNATDAASVGKAEASSEAAGLRELVDEVAEAYPYDYRIVAVRTVGFKPAHLQIA